MKKRRNSLFIVFCTGLLILPACRVYSEESIAVPPEFIGRFRELARMLGLEDDVSGDGFSARGRTLPDGIHVWRLWLPPLQVDIDSETGEVRYIHNGEEDARRQDRAEKISFKIKPEKTSREAEKRAREFVEKIRGSLPGNVSSIPEINFGRPYSEGGWFVRWYREEKGYKYPNDWVFVHINDETGNLISYSIRLISKKLVSADVGISKKQAVETALNIARYFFEEGDPFYKSFGFSLPDKPSSVELGIVHPNKEFSGEEVLSGVATESVLAYIVKFELAGDWGPRMFLIWIDAKTGRLAGGDRS